LKSYLSLSKFKSQEFESKIFNLKSDNFVLLYDITNKIGIYS